MGVSTGVDNRVSDAGVGGLVVYVVCVCGPELKISCGKVGKETGAPPPRLGSMSGFERGEFRSVAIMGWGEVAAGGEVAAALARWSRGLVGLWRRSDGEWRRSGRTQGGG